ncbi:MAG: AbrB/MazE/SpoVT family DNA-binding domain-containing protein [Nocardioidaceae bacterium]|nr:AbrB/MazE/SpoVT family DNA-binding domain-containing protein [Nocardioidaceae bacterium]
MRVTIDQSGRFVIPKAVRDRLRLEAGTAVEIVEDGAGLRIEPVPPD